MIRELVKSLPPEKQAEPDCRELAAWGCHTTMHVARLLAPALAAEAYWKDIDFSAEGIRWKASCCTSSRRAPAGSRRRAVTSGRESD